MSRFIVPAAAAVVLGALSFGLPGSASAAAFSPGGIATPDSGVQEARMTRREMRRRRMMRHRMRRRMAPSQAGNAQNPSRPVSQQNQGSTTGGPRY